MAARNAQRKPQQQKQETGTDLVRVEAALGKGIASKFNAARAVSLDWTSEKRYALAILTDPKNDYLRKIALENPQSVADALLDASRLGLSLSPVSRQAYLVPYGGKSPRVTLAPSYIGMEQSVLRSEKITLIQSGLVHANDEWEQWTDKDGANFKHRPARKDRGEVERAYCLAKYANGESHLEVMEIDELDGCMEAAIKKNNDQVPPAWKGSWKPEMQKKCVVRRAAKHWPTDKHVELVMEQFDRVNPMDFGTSTVRTVEAVVCLSPEDIEDVEKAIMHEKLSPEARAVWMQRTATAMGFADGVDTVPLERKDEMISRLKDRLEKVFPAEEKA